MSEQISWIGMAMLAAEAVFTAMMVSNHHYARKKYQKQRYFRPNALVIIPCKGLDENFQANIESFCLQDYQPYRLWFVVEDEKEPALPVIQQSLARLNGCIRALEYKVLFAGKANGCSQKLHNLLYAIQRAPDDVEVFVFADSDVHAKPMWLAQIVAPLRKKKIGLATGYRWFVPKTNRLANLFLSAMNAKVCQLMGNTRFNLAWGGSMAVRRADFERLEVAAIWQKSLSDDLTLSKAIRDDGLLVRFVPACLNASWIEMTWLRLFEFARRQFVITRIYAPALWWFGLFGTLFSLTAFCCGVVWAGRSMIQTADNLVSFFIGLGLLVCPVVRAVLRQRTATMILSDCRPAMRAAQWVDILFFWLAEALMALILVGSAFGKTIRWRSICYHIRKPDEVVIITEDKDLQ